MKTYVELLIEDPDLLVGLVEGEGVTVSGSDPEFLRTIEALVDNRREEDFPPPEFRTKIRKLLRRGGFRPSGRNKPASEYLARAAEAGSYPFHSNVVDVCNYVSLLSGLPISILDIDRAVCETDRLVIRLGNEKESYVFNPTGQEIDITGLICVARLNGVALGNPVKDSMTSKVHTETTRVLGVVYGSRCVVSEEEMRNHLDLFAGLLREHAGAVSTGVSILSRSAR